MAPFLFLPHFCLRSQPIWVWEAPPVVSAFPPAPLPYSVIVPDAARNASWQTLSAVISTNWCVCVCVACVCPFSCALLCACVCTSVCARVCLFAVGICNESELFICFRVAKWLTSIWVFRLPSRPSHTSTSTIAHTHTHTQLHTPDQLCIKSIKYMLAWYSLRGSHTHT